MPKNPNSGVEVQIELVAGSITTSKDSSSIHPLESVNCSVYSPCLLGSRSPGLNLTSASVEIKLFGPDHTKSNSSGVVMFVFKISGRDEFSQINPSS